jgi:hypothetical protein
MSATRPALKQSSSSLPTISGQLSSADQAAYRRMATKNLSPGNVSLANAKNASAYCDDPACDLIDQAIV